MGTVLQANPTRTSHAKGAVEEEAGVEAKQVFHVSSEYNDRLTRCLGFVGNQAPHKVRMGTSQVSHQLVQIFLW